MVEVREARPEDWPDVEALLAELTLPEAWIPDLVVAESARSRGVGAALLARAEELARDRGCFAMSLESASWRTRAHAFYVRQHWIESGKSFARLLAEGTWPPQPRG